MEILTAVLFVLALEFALIFLSSNSRTARFFSVVPAIFWMYFLPGVFAKLGWLRVPEALSGFSSRWLMPLALILIVAPADLKRLVRMGKESFLALWAVYFSMVIGAAVSYFVFRAFFAPDVWKAFAALGATWTGGTVNMLAVKEIVGLNESQFSVMVITDAFLSYGWMIFLMMAFRWHSQFNAWIGSRVPTQADEVLPNFKKWFHVKDSLWMTVSIALVFFAHFLGTRMPATASFPIKAWILLIASVLAIVAAGTGWNRLIQTRFAESCGAWLLYFVLMTMRAQTDFLPEAHDFWIIFAGFVWLMVHGILMILYAKIFRVRLSVLAVASQAAVGGVVSAPIVAALYDSSLVSAAVLMGIFGNLVGTYLGLLIGHCIRVLHI